eukprot:scaffold23743_cov44-Cyclotella_meneghiniana.AAC.2
MECVNPGGYQIVPYCDRVVAGATMAALSNEAELSGAMHIGSTTIHYTDTGHGRASSQAALTTCDPYEGGMAVE